MHECSNGWCSPPSRHPLPVAFAMVKCATEIDIERVYSDIYAKWDRRSIHFTFAHLARTHFIAQSVGWLVGAMHNPQQIRFSCSPAESRAIWKWVRYCNRTKNVLLLLVLCEPAASKMHRHTRPAQFLRGGEREWKNGKTGFLKIAFSCAFLMVRRQVHRDWQSPIRHVPTASCGTVCAARWAGRSPGQLAIQENNPNGYRRRKRNEWMDVIAFAAHN